MVYIQGYAWNDKATENRCSEIKSVRHLRDHVKVERTGKNYKGRGFVGTITGEEAKELDDQKLALLVNDFCFGGEFRRIGNDFYGIIYCG